MIGKERYGWLRLGCTLLLALLVAACATAPPAPPAQSPGSRTVATDAGRLAAHYALQQVGAPYRYGGASPDGFDCSGLVQYAYRQAGRSLPRTTGQLWDFTVPVKRANLQPGDLLFFSISGRMQHVGLYLGDNRFVHAPKSGRTVSVASLSSDFYRDALLRAGRPPVY
jgi:cell wall-associated NlpC family hydrolase